MIRNIPLPLFKALLHHSMDLKVITRFMDDVN